MSFARIVPSNLERRELHLAFFACVSLLILALGTALLMYPAVFYSQENPPQRTLRIAFVGFCVLSVLLTAYLWESNATIRRLRQQIETDREASWKARREACEELLRNIPKLDSFQDRLAMEYRRTVAATHHLSVVVIRLQFAAGASEAECTLILGDIAKAISRKLSERDSIYLFGRACLGVLLPGLEATLAQSVASVVSSGVTDAGGVVAPFTYKIDLVNYPLHASSEHQLYSAVLALIPRDGSKYELAEALN